MLLRASEQYIPKKINSIFFFLYSSQKYRSVEEIIKIIISDDGTFRDPRRANAITKKVFLFHHMGPPPPLDSSRLKVHVKTYDLFHELNRQH